MNYSAHILFTLLIVAFIVVSTMTKNYRPDSGIWRYVYAIILRIVQSKPFKSIFNKLKIKLEQLSSRIKKIPLFCKHRNRGNLTIAIIFLLFLNSVAVDNMAYTHIHKNSYTGFENNIACQWKYISLARILKNPAINTNEYDITKAICLPNFFQNKYNAEYICLCQTRIKNSYSRLYKLCTKQIAKHGINNAADPAKNTSYMRYQTFTKQLVI